MRYVLNLFLMYSINEKGNYKRQGMTAKHPHYHKTILHVQCTRKRASTLCYLNCTNYSLSPLFHTDTVTGHRNFLSNNNYQLIDMQLLLTMSVHCQTRKASNMKNC